MQLTSYFIVKKIYYSVTFNFTNSILVAVTLIILKWNLSKVISSCILGKLWYWCRMSPPIIPLNINPLNSKVMNNKKKNEGQADFSYYGLYLLDYLRTNKFEQADDTAFIRERADRAAETYERARLEGYPADGAQELAMDTLLRGLHYSRYAILREVVENEFADEVPEEKREAFVLKLLPLVGNVFSVYDLSDDNFALSSDYDLLYTELTGATVLYLDEYGV